MTWQTVRVSDLGRVVTGDTPPKSRPEFYGSAYPFIKPTDMKVGQRYTDTYEESFTTESARNSVRRPVGTYAFDEFGDTSKLVAICRLDQVAVACHLLFDELQDPEHDRIGVVNHTN